MSIKPKKRSEQIKIAKNEVIYTKKEVNKMDNYYRNLTLTKT